jgi:hypothetical protein
VAKTPLIYISYGITKSGSTLAFELTKTILEENGFPQKRLSDDAIRTKAVENFVHRLSSEQLEIIEREVKALGYPIVLKTHQRLSPAVQDWVREGRIHGHCVYRDLREVVVSMMDHGSRARAEGSAGFSKIQSFNDAIRSLRMQLPRFLEWVRLPGFLVLYYDDIAFNTQATIGQLCAQLGLDADPARVEQITKQERFIQYNKGVPGRAKELDPEISKRVVDEFRDFFDEFIHKNHKPEPPVVHHPPEPPTAKPDRGPAAFVVHIVPGAAGALPHATLGNRPDYRDVALAMAEKVNSKQKAFAEPSIILAEQRAQVTIWAASKEIAEEEYQHALAEHRQNV